MDNAKVEIDSSVNEIYSKTIVTQEFENQSNNPIELRIYIYKIQNCIFSSFSAQIGDSIKVKSKVIKEEKAEEKYNDSISSGNAAIFVSKDPNNSNRVIINMGNIPPKAKVTFISEFLQFIQTSEKYEFEIFRNLPIFTDSKEAYQFKSITGKIEIKTKNEIMNIEKTLLSDKIKIREEKYLDEDKKNNYSIKYEYNNLGKINIVMGESYYYRKDTANVYLPSSKIYFDLNQSGPNVYSQNSPKDMSEKSYIVQYKYACSNSENNYLNPAIFIFLIDQSGSMSGSAIKVASKALLLFLQSLPGGSYYQIIGFGSDFKAYDKEPKEYNENNIKNSIELINKLGADLGGTNIYDPLEFIYNSGKIYDKINLPRNIFLLTDGEIEDKEKTLSLIENNSNKYFIYSIGIGNDFDEDLIKNAGVLGKGSYNFCKNIENLNKVIATELNSAVSTFITDFKIKSFLDDKKNLIQNRIPNVIKKNQIIYLSYIIDNKENNNEINEKEKINLDIDYMEHDINKENEKENKNEKYEIEIDEIKSGEDLSKLIINNYLLNSDLNNDEKIQLALKYQLLINGTSLFAEVELEEKITEEMKSKIMGNKEINIIKKQMDIIENDNVFYRSASKKKESIFTSIGNSIKNFFSFNKRKVRACEFADDYDCCVEKECYIKDTIEISPNYMIRLEKEEIGGKREKKEEKSVNEKDSVMNIINSQDFIQGFWEVNELTKTVMEKYKKEFDMLKGLEGMDDKIAMTILIIYFINKEHSDLLSELILIIKKGKQYIQKNMKDNYENIIQKVGLN